MYASTVHLTANEVLAEVFPSILSFGSLRSKYGVAISVVIDYIGMGMCRIDNCALQVTGEENYITGDIRLLDFKAVRKYVIKLHVRVVQ